jgi:hypothetical protein
MMKFEPVCPLCPYEILLYNEYKYLYYFFFVLCCVNLYNTKFVWVFVFQYNFMVCVILCVSNMT